MQASKGNHREQEPLTSEGLAPGSSRCSAPKIRERVIGDSHGGGKPATSTAARPRPTLNRNCPGWTNSALVWFYFFIFIILFHLSLVLFLFLLMWAWNRTSLTCIKYNSNLNKNTRKGPFLFPLYFALYTFVFTNLPPLLPLLLLSFIIVPRRSESLALDFIVLSFLTTRL